MPGLAPIGTEKFHIVMDSELGEVPGVLTVNENIIMFDPDVEIFEKRFVTNENERALIQRYDTYIDMDDVFAVRVQQQLYDKVAGTF
jgi:hypothetical protein